jgi:hypothetical protein
MLSNQQIFDKVIGHMRQQGNPWGTYAGFKSKGRSWSYVNPTNPCQRCARGILLDVKLDESTNTYKPNVLSPYYSSSKSTNQITASLINALEWIFEFENPTNWENEFEKVSQRFHVIYTEKFNHISKEVSHV